MSQYSSQASGLLQDYFQLSKILQAEFITAACTSLAENINRKHSIDVALKLYHL
jgi:hypothetical protein